ncbi:hypothetical protein JOM56_008376 [Amanita muscaria]
MLRASSLGFSILFAGIRIRRRGHTGFLSSQLPKTRCTPVLFSNDAQSTGGQRRDGQDVTEPSDTLSEKQRNVHRESTLYAILKPNLSSGVTSDIHRFEAEPSGPALVAQQDPTRVPRAENHIPSYPAGQLLFPSVRKIRRGKKLQSRQWPFIGLHEEGGDLDVKNIRNELLRVLETTNSATTAWNVYTKLSHMIPDGHCSPNKPFIPFVHLHRVSRLLSRNRPQTHIQFLRLFSVLDVLRSSGGRIHAYEWNTLIDHTARGWRKARVEDWELALSLYNDMVLGRPPGATFEGDVQASKGDENHIVKPDIYTYCSLLNVAVSTRQSQAVRRAIALLNASKIPPNRITFLTLLKHYSTTRHMSGVRSTVLKMREQGFELGLDGINACLWTYGWNGRLDIVTTIYRLLRYNASSEQEGTRDVILTLRRQLEEEEYICISDDIRPDGTTFATVIQLMAHYGDLLTTLSVFVDMLYILPSQPATSNGANLRMTPPLNTIFRAIFLGFSQNGIPPCQDKNQLPSHIRISNPPDRPHWTLKNLQAMFDAFLSLPAEIRASRSTVYWIMNAFDVTSGQNEDVLREVWGKLEARLGAGFVVHWVAPTNRLAKWRQRLFPELSKGERGDEETEDDASIP